MCELIRYYQPNATIVVGGHVANLPDLDKRIDADEIVKGEEGNTTAKFEPYFASSIKSPIRLYSSGDNEEDRKNAEKWKQILRQASDDQQKQGPAFK